ncbi:MAG: hypothetical protein QOF48_1553 [Verrucomicrobiota bacterium]|jgi:hypothetical protein
MPPSAPVAVAESQRDFVTWPKVARHELPWVKGASGLNPEWGCGLPWKLSSQGSPFGGQPWADGLNPFGIFQTGVPQRGNGPKPKVGAGRLPWVSGEDQANANGVAEALRRIADRYGRRSQPHHGWGPQFMESPSGGQPWADGLNPFEIFRADTCLRKGGGAAQVASCCA